MATAHSPLDTADCLARWLESAGGELSVDAARFFLAIRIPEDDRNRIAALLRRQGTGGTNLQEEAELRDVLHLVQLIEMLQMRSRVVLQRADAE